MTHGQIVTGDAEPVHGQLASDLADDRNPRELTIRLPPDWSVGPAPLYRRLADAIASALAIGTLRDRLPSEQELAEGSGVSRTTAVAAYAVLVDRGMLERRPGSGTFVRSRASSAHICVDPIDCVLGFFAELH